jgi:hypothetical protein
MPREFANSFVSMLDKPLVEENLAIDSNCAVGSVCCLSIVENSVLKPYGLLGGQKWAS